METKEQEKKDLPISVLDNFILRSKITDYQRAFREILELALFSDRFLCFTEVCGEISLMLDEKSIQKFSGDVLVELTERWKAIQIYEGAEAINQTGWVQKLSQPLAKEGIDMLYLSSYHTDLILVEEQNQAQALNLLKNASLSGTAKQDTTPISGLNCLSVEGSEADSILQIVSLPRNHLNQLTSEIVKFFLDVERSETNFFSFLSSGNEITLIIPKQNNILQENFTFDFLSINSSSWKYILISAGADGFDVTMVNSVAKILASHKISLFYLSTCDQDFILVEDFNFDNALELLKKSFS